MNTVFHGIRPTYLLFGVLVISGNHIKLAIEAVCRIWLKEGNGTIFDCITQNWFENFKSGDFSLEMKPRNEQPPVSALKQAF